MKKGKSKGNFLFILGLSIVVLVAFVVGFAFLYKDSSLVFESNGYIINATENSSESYSFLSGAKYKKNVSGDIAFETDESKDVSVDSASFIHYDNGSISFLQNGALLDLDEINKEYMSYYNISNKITVEYEDGKYSITNDTKNLTFSSWIARISDDKYIVVGKDISLLMPGVSKNVTGDYFELLFLEDGIVKIDNKDVSYQVTAQDTYIYLGNALKIDLGENKILYNDNDKLLLSQITISGDENIDLEEGTGTGTGSGTGTGDGTGSGTNTSGTNTSGTVTSGSTGDTSIVTSVTTGSGTAGGGGTGSGTAGADGGNGGDGSGDGTGVGDGEGSGAGSGGSTGSESGENTVASATIDLIKIDITSNSMYAYLQMNQSVLIDGALTAYLTNVGTGTRDVVSLVKKDGTLELCSSGVDCYSFNRNLLPDSEYLITIVDNDYNKQYFQKMFSTSELGVTLERLYATSNSLTYNVNFSLTNNVSSLDLYLYDSNSNEIDKKVGINDNTEVTFYNLKSYDNYQAVIKNVSICDEDNNCMYNEEFEISRTDTTLKTAPSINKLSVNKNSDSGSFDLVATFTDKYETATKYTYTICKEVARNETPTECIVREKTDSDPLNIKVGTDVDSGVSYIYYVTVLYNNGVMDREIISSNSASFTMASLPYFQLENKSITANSITGDLTLMDPSCTVPIKGRVCNNSNNSFRIRYYKYNDGEEKATEIVIDRSEMNVNSSGNYSYPLSLTGLAAETKYVIKVYGSYYLDETLHEDVQIGNELVFDTTSTGNLKLVYTDQKSSDDEIVNFNVRFSGGDDDSTEESAVTKIEKITFDLYAGNYEDDSEINNRHIGTQLVLSGNKNIRMSLCNEDTDSFSCDTKFKYSIKSSLFELSSGDLLTATGKIANLCTSNKFNGKCLYDTYTVVAKAYDSAGNAIKIDNYVYNYKISSDYYVTKTLSLNTDSSNKGGIFVDLINKVHFKDSDGNYDYEELSDAIDSELKKKDAFYEHIDELDDETTLGLTVSSIIPASYINATYDYDKVVTTFYVCDDDDEKTCSDDGDGLIKVSEKLDSINYSNLSYNFYLNDSNFTRGNSYKIMYVLEFTDSKGDISYYSSEYTVKLVDIGRQAPIYNFYILNSTKDSITYNYKITDIDNSLDKDDYYFYYKIKGDESYTKLEQEFELNVSGNVTFPITCIEESCEYSIALKEKIYFDIEYVNLDSTSFDKVYLKEDYDLLNNSFSLKTYDTDNRLYIILNDDIFDSRTLFYNVKLYDTSNNVIFNRGYLNSKIDSCSGTGEGEDVSIVCGDNTSKFRYITVDFADVASYINTNIKVSVDSYFDTGLVGTNQTFTNGLILENITNGGYINMYASNSGGTKKIVQSEDNECNSIYLIDNGSFNSNDVTIHNMLNITSIDSYSSSIGASLFSGEVSTVNESFVVSPIPFNGKSIKKLYAGIKVGAHYGYYPKVVDYSSLGYEDDENTFSFDSIIPKVKTTNTVGINSLKIDFEYSGISNDSLSSQFKNESGSYYFYIDLFLKDDDSLIGTEKVKINTSGTTSHTFKNLDVKTNYYYKVYVYTKNGTNYEKTQVFDGSISNSYKSTTYYFNTLKEEELLSKVTFKVNASSYNNDDNIDAISNKKITYGVNIANGSYVKLRLELYDIDGNNVNLGSLCANSSTPNYTEIDSANYSIGSENNGYTCTFNNYDYVFGDGYYTLKVYAIPYYSSGTNYVQDSNPNGYSEDKMLLIYDKVLSTTTSSKNDKASDTIDVHALQLPSNFGEPVLSSSCDGSTSTSCSVSLVYMGVVDSDYVVKNGIVKFNLYNDTGDLIKTISKDSNNNTYSVLDKHITITFDGLNINTNYTVEISYDTYRNNIGFTEEEKTEISPYSNSIFTPIGSGITLGNVIISKLSDIALKIEYIDSNNLAQIKRVDYKVILKGGASNTSGTITGTIFKTDKSGTNSLTIDLSKNNTVSYNLTKKGTYNVTISYYSDEEGLNKIYSHTLPILVN